MLSQVCFHVPSEALPALIGVKGAKHRDLEATSRTKIILVDQLDGQALVTIRGHLPNCELARSLVHMTIRHFQASLSVVEPRREELNIDHAALDLKTLLFEIYSSKC